MKEKCHLNSFRKLYKIPSIFHGKIFSLVNLTMNIYEINKKNKKKQTLTALLG